MAEDFTAEDLPEWTGSLLSYGAFLAYAQRTVEIVPQDRVAAPPQVREAAGRGGGGRGTARAGGA